MATKRVEVRAPMSGIFYGQPGPDDPPYVKVGDTVLFGKYSGTEVKVEGEELLVMREDDIMAIIEK